MKGAGLLLTPLVLVPALAAQPNPLNLFIADLSWKNGRPVVGTPKKLTNDVGTNSQPSFSADGKAIVFSGLRGDGPDARSDIYRIDLVSGKEARVTTTSENENSPTVSPAGGYYAVRWVPATLFKEYGLWEYQSDGTPLRGVLPGPDTTGYYTPLGNGDFALMRPKNRNAVALFSGKNGTISDLDSIVANLPPQRIPRANAISYTHTDSTGRNEIRRVNLDDRAVSVVAPTLVSRTVHVWLNGETLLMGKGNTVYTRRVGRDTAWVPVASFDSPELRNVTTYVVSPQGDKLVLTSPMKLALNVAIRDRLEAGQPVAQVVADMSRLRDTNGLSDFALAVGAVTIADDRRLVKPGTDEILLLDFLRSLFPTQHRVWGRLGDAHAAAKDVAKAREAYGKALELNTRGTAADSAAAARVEKALKELP